MRKYQHTLKSENFCKYSIWSISRYEIFAPIYSRLKDARLLRITDKKTYKAFIIAGQLYSKFLKEQPWKTTKTDADADDNFDIPVRISNNISVKSDRKPIFIEKLPDILSANFSNGYRLNSPIEMIRFRAFAADEFGTDISLSDEELQTHIAACGINFDGKVYIVSAEVEERIRGLAENYFADGAKAIFSASRTHFQQDDGFYRCTHHTPAEQYGFF